jgi:hypothetical protein
VNARERWQALQAELSAARAALGRADRTEALAHVDRALAIDPQFLAAISLRERILNPLAAAPLPPRASSDRPAFLAESASNADAPAAEAPRPLVSTEGYAKFEARAKRRRVDRRIEAARAAIARRKVKEAASALDEVIELDPNVPELAPLTAAFEELRRSTAHPHRGPWVMAAAVFVAMVLGASWLQESRVLQSRQVGATAKVIAVPAAPTPLEAAPLPIEQAAPTTGADVPQTDLSEAPLPVAEREPEPETVPPVSAPRRADAPERIAERAASARPPESTTQARSSPTPLSNPPQPQPSRPVVSAPLQPLPDEVPVAPPPTTSTARVVAPAARAPEPIVAPAPAPPVDVARPAVLSENTPHTVSSASSIVPTMTNQDELLVKQALQRYRVAYEGLDAQSARSVWPAVNEAALARAFDGLESQRLTFDACNVQVSGDHATATCRGSARYVPKVGSREPRVEPRVWSFALRKMGAEWKIDNARAER